MTQDKNNSEKISKKDKKNKENIKIKELEEKINEKNNDYLRLLADFENYRKRSNKEIVESKNIGKINLIEELLPIIDNLEMSLKLKEKNPDMVIKGVEMIHKNLISILEEQGLKSFKPQINEDFNPILHEPILIEDKNAQPFKIIDIVNKGYKFQDKIIRLSKVKIKKEDEILKENENTNLQNDL